jgi:hypothetical protein
VERLHILTSHDFTPPIYCGWQQLLGDPEKENAKRTVAIMSQLERVRLRRIPSLPDKGGRALSHDKAAPVRRNPSRLDMLLNFQRTHGNAFVQRLVRRSFITGVVARQPKPDPGWSDAPEKGLNVSVTTVDEKGNITAGKAAGKGIWRVPIEDLSHGFQGPEKGAGVESPKAKAVALIPNIVKLAAPEKGKTAPVDVLLHLHGYGIGYRELDPKKQDYAKVLQPGQLRDVALYQMEQQLMSHVKASQRLLIAVLPQGSERSNFGDLSSKSDAYLTEVFAKLVPKYLPQGAIPGRVIVSGHSGGGPTAMAAAKAGKRKDVLLFDAINSSCTDKEEAKDKDGNTLKDKKGNPVMKCKQGSPCASNEYFAVSKWVTDNMTADVLRLDGVAEDKKKDELEKNGARFRGYTSASLTTKNSCSYGYWYNKVKSDIETTITKLKVSEAVAGQLRQNYQVQEAKGLTGLKDNEPHERVLGQGNLEAALKY